MQKLILLALFACFQIACAAGPGGSVDGEDTTEGAGGSDDLSTGGEDASGGAIDMGGTSTGTPGTGGSPIGMGGTPDVGTGGTPDVGTGGTDAGTGGAGTGLDCSEATSWEVATDWVTEGIGEGDIFLFEGGLYEYHSNLRYSMIEPGCPPIPEAGSECEFVFDYLRYSFTFVGDCP